MIIGHPGHELRVYHWVETTRPQVLVLTDGSGRTNRSRLASTSRILRAVGASPGPVYGRFTDVALYEVMLRGRTDLVAALVGEVADWLEAGEFATVAGDALEGYNTSHDLCRYLIGAACERVRRQTGRVIANYDFPLIGRPDDCPAELQADAIVLRLDEAATARKFAAAEEYPELKHEVTSDVKRFGRSALASEWLRPVSNDVGLDPPSSETPFYETHGQKQRDAGHYQTVIRRQEHILPLARAMWDVASA